jgi:serine protein kinase
VQAQSAGVRHRGRAHAQSHRRAANGRHAQRSALSRIFANKVIKIYPAFAEFFGMEDAIEQVVSYFRHAAQGLEEKKQVLYLLGPVGGGKSSIAERLKAADGARAVLCHQGLAGERVSARAVRPHRGWADSREGIRHPSRYLNRVMSPWA